MLKTELEAWKKDAEDKAAKAHKMIDGKSYAEVPVHHWKEIFVLLCEIAGKDVPSNDEE